MYLEKLEIYGFKSFAHKLTLEFGPGITGIVGPNGCGKTNVADAIRWVLGEQSASELRGSSMSDVVFSGTRKRRRLGRAEVNLTIDNSGGYLPTDYAQVVIGRKVYRSGESEYLINKTPCRLRDVKDLFLDTGIGTRTYSLIERKMVDSVLSDSAGHRRFMFEEAAGIMKYKVRKRSALNKLEATEADMQRVADIISEVEKQVRSLKRQLAQARRHRRYTDELARLEVGLARRDYGEWSEQRRGSLARAEELRARIASHAELLERDDSATREARAALSAQEETLATLDEQVGTVAAEARNLADALLVARERKRAAERRVQELAPEIGSLRSDLENVHSQLESVRAGLAEASSAAEEQRQALEERAREFRRVDREYWSIKKDLAGEKQTRLEGLESSAGLKGELESYRARLDDLNDEHATVEAALADARKELVSREAAILEALETEKRLMAAARTTRDREVATENDLDIAREALLASREGKTRAEGELEAARHKLTLLQEMRDGYGGFTEGVRALLTDRSHGIAGLRGTVADVLAVEPTATSAIEAALGEAAQFVVANSREDAQRAMDHLARNQQGRATFVPLDEIRRVPVVPVPADIIAREGVLGRATDFIRCDDEIRGAAELLLEGTVVVDGMATALSLAGSSSVRGLTFASTDGEIVSSDGLITGGTHSAAEAGLLRRRERVTEAEREVERLERTLEDAVRLEGEAVAALHRLTSESRERGVETEQAEADLWEAKRKLTEIELARTTAAGRVEELSARRDAVGQRMVATRTDVENLAGRLAQLSKGEDEIGERLDDLQERFVRLEGEREAAIEQQRTAELAVATAEATLKQLRAEETQLTERISSTEASIDRKSAEDAEHAAALEQLSESLEGDGRRLEEVTARQEELTARRDAVRAETRRLRTRLDEVEGTSRGAREERDAMQRELHEIELRDTELRGRAEALRERILEDYSIDIAAPAPVSARSEEDRGEFADDDRDGEHDADRDGEHDAEREAEHDAERDGSHGISLTLDESDEPTDWEATRQEVDRLKARLRSMGPVNLLALDEYDEESKRLEFLHAQYEDLERSKSSLIQAIGQINEAARKMFVETFEQVRQNFVSMFERLFEGGEADLRLLEPDDPLESPIEIVASPREKKLGRLSLLSGGERALTAIALLFAIYLVKPSPFCILDEVDAPLDDANVHRFIRMLREFSERTQFIIITHNKVTMQATDRLYGVTMEESGVSKVVSVRLDAMGNEVEREEIAYEAV